MRTFDRGSRSGGGRGFGGPRSRSGGRSFGSRDYGTRGDREMHHAVCSNCGRDCEVPFKPTGSKPVLCNDCFAQQKDSEPRRFNDRGGDRGDRPSQNSNRQLDVINAKLDQILTLLNGAPKGKAPKAPKVAKIEEPKEEVANLDVSDMLGNGDVAEFDPNNSIETTPKEE